MDHRPTTSESTTALSPEQLRAHQIKQACEQRRLNWRHEFAEMLDDLDLRKVDMNDHDPERRDDLVEDVLSRDFVATIGGEHKSGKSSLATDVAVCLTAREPTKFLGYFPVCKGCCPVVYLDYEGTDNEFRDRLQRIEAARGVHADQDKLHVFQHFPKLHDDAGPAIPGLRGMLCPNLRTGQAWL
ncbi:MAG: AAA family ATPase [Pirellulaceae bacterium]